MREIYKQYTVHDDQNIKGFFDEYRWLSNFHLCTVVYEGLTYPSSENAYQAAKIIPEQREVFCKYTPAQSKRLWTSFVPVDKTEKQWLDRKYNTMYQILVDKYTRNEDMKKLLLETGDKYLEETNHWSDSEWGVYYKTGEGKNNLGKILMGVRNLIKSM